MKPSPNGKRTAILEALRESGRTQSDLATWLGVSQGAVSRYIRGTRDPQLPIAIRMAGLLNRPVEELFMDLVIPKRHGRH